MDRLTVVCLFSASYSGTTWINLVLASHPRGLYVGAGERPWTLAPEQAEGACLTHAADCPFWPSFLRGYDRGGNALQQLADHAGRSLLVLSNPPDWLLAQIEAAGEAIDARFIKLTRDGRAILTSYLRHHPERAASLYQAARDYLKPSWRRNLGRVPDDPRRTLWLRYEDFIADWRGQLSRIGDFIGVTYDDSAIRFWECEHHMASGNTGLVDLLRRLQGGDGIAHHRRAHYDALLQQARLAPEVPLPDESWREVLSPLDRAAYDFVLGEEHAAQGYERDRFAPETVIAFLHRHRPPLEREARPSVAPESAPASPVPGAWRRMVQRLGGRTA